MFDVVLTQDELLQFTLGDFVQHIAHCNGDIKSKGIVNLGFFIITENIKTVEFDFTYIIHKRDLNSKPKTVRLKYKIYENYKSGAYISNSFKSKKLFGNLEHDDILAFKLELVSDVKLLLSSIWLKGGRYDN